jgi:hypothetical protein
MEERTGDPKELVADLEQHAVALQQALNNAIGQEVLARRDLDEYRKAEIAELRRRLAEIGGERDG